MATQTILSVRGEARRTVAPDLAVLHVTVRAVAGPRVGVLAQLRATREQLIAGLAGLGGAPLTVDTDRAAVSWSFGSMSVHDEHHLEDATGRHGPTGRVLASMSGALIVRDPELLPALAEVLGTVEHVNVDDIGWEVDADNPAWPVVRADAIRTALAKARDYAEALGGTVTAVEHVADAGLLSGTDQLGVLGYVTQSASFAGGGSSGDGVPTLDPVPQLIQATVEARVHADVDPLA